MKTDTIDLEEITEPYIPEGTTGPISGYMTGYLASLGNGDRKHIGLESGIKQIDDILGGLDRFVLLAGRSGAGKSTLALQLAMGVARTEQVPVIYYSFEMEQHSVISMALQASRADKTDKLYQSDIELHGNDPKLLPAKRAAITEAAKELADISDRFYIIDTYLGKPDLDVIAKEITAIKELHKAEKMLVVIDSIQDVVPSGRDQTSAEASAAGKLVEIQQATGATILAISQKNKQGVKDGDDYGGVLGSVALIHKPTTVVTLYGKSDLKAKLKGNISRKGNDAHENFEQALSKAVASKGAIPDPVVMKLTKARNTQGGYLPLKFYGAYRYFEVGQHPSYQDVYDLIETEGL